MCYPISLFWTEYQCDRVAGDVGGQKTLRSYWRNYFEKTDALIWVVDATDRLRIGDCRDELAGLLLEEVILPFLQARARLTTTATHGSEPTGVPQQDRRRRLHG